MLTSTDPLGNTTRSEYDSKGRLTHTIDATGHVNTYSYDANSNLTAMTKLLADGTPLTLSTFAYDAQGRMTSTTDGAGFTRTFEYDANGNQKKSSYQAFNIAYANDFGAGASSDDDFSTSGSGTWTLAEGRYLVEYTSGPTHMRAVLDDGPARPIRVYASYTRYVR